MHTSITGLIALSLAVASASWAANPRVSGEQAEKPAQKRAVTSPPPAPASPAGQGTGAPASPGLSDAQIATVVQTAHQIGVERGKLAQKRAQSPEVKQFADQMVREHSQGQAEAVGLAKKLNAKAEESEVSRGLKAEAADKVLLLKRLSGKDFDKAYVDAEVAYHQGLLDAVDRALAPAVKAGELKGAVQGARTAVASHLQHARNLQTALAGAK